MARTKQTTRSTEGRVNTSVKRPNIVPVKTERFDKEKLIKELTKNNKKLKNKILDSQDLSIFYWNEMSENTLTGKELKEILQNIKGTSVYLGFWEIFEVKHDLDS